MATIDGPDDFWKLVRVGVRCWIYTGWRTGSGSGQVCVRGEQRKVLAHRYSWELEYGPIPERKWVLHHCDCRRCVRPSHLYLGTYRENVADALRRGRYQKKVSDADVVAMREDRARGMGLSALADKYGVCTMTVSLIVRGRSRRHLPGPIQPNTFDREPNPAYAAAQEARLTELVRRIRAGERIPEPLPELPVAWLDQVDPASPSAPSKKSGGV